MESTVENFRFQKRIAFFTSLFFLLKLGAWYITHSIAILTDTLEYTINVVSSFIGLYSLYLAAKPRDENHPYGHGKVEFISAAIEGTLMIVSAFLIIYEAINNLEHPHTIQKLDYGIYAVALSGLLNYVVGFYAERKGKKNNSLALEATGHHMQSDTYATGGILIGLLLLYFTGYTWIDSVVSFIFASIIIVSGYKILRSSVAGIMDEADTGLLEKLVALANASRTENWVDMHNLRIIKYGSILHLDCHLTVPWYMNVHEAHREIDRLDRLVKENFGESVELFVHTDGCLDFSCAICTKSDCSARKTPFVKRVEWSISNISSNRKHRIEEGA